MLKIFGKNNNQLFRNSQKTTYSMPQSLPFSEHIFKCACGFDFMAIITATGRLYFLFQAKFYACDNVPMLWDIATAENTVTMLTRDREVLVWDFDEEKICSGGLNYTKIRVNLDGEDSISKVEMGSGDIFLISESGRVLHFKRNQWYETKTYSNIESVELSHKIIDVSSGPCLNLFLSYQGLLFRSSKQDPLHLIYVDTPHKFIKVSTGAYHAGITKKGTVMVWGSSIHGNYREPTQLCKLTKKFVDIKVDKQNSYALADDGEVWVWGVNANGELGLSDYEKRIKPFPLITLEKNHVLAIFCAHSYACCLCEPQEKSEKNPIKVLDRKVTEFNTLREEGKITAVKPRTNGKKDPIYIEEQEYEVMARSTESPQLNMKKGPAKPMEKKSVHKKSVSENSRSGSPSPTPKSKHSKADKKYETKSKSKANPGQNYKQTKNTWLISQRENEQDSQTQQSRTLHLQLNQLKQQNERLKQRISQQDSIIIDITDKIRLLQQAIDQHERNLTSRDSILQEYQAKEQDYLSHIDELQKTIDEIVRFKEKNKEVMVIYEDLKSNFEKERAYYTDKIRDCEIKFHQQELSFKDEIDDLKKKLAAKQQGRKQNDHPVWQSHSPILKKSQLPYFKYEFLGERNMNSVDQAIDQIESNKSRITKSANKLLAMLDVSQ